ncbi:hypothetical protein JXR93_08160 [bacterium]|nr:hypothetical protein [bacterium]
MKAIFETLLKEIKNREIKRVKASQHMIAIESERVGLASNLGDSNDISDYIGKRDIFSFAEMIFSDNLLERSLAIAAINSALPEIQNREITAENGYNLLERYGVDKTVGVIGHFPFVKKLKPLVKNLYVFELEPQEGDISADQFSKYIGEIDILGLTATTLINNTYEGIYNQFHKNLKTIMIGPSTPMSDIMFSFGIDVLSGSIVDNGDLFFSEMERNLHFRETSGRKPFNVFK